MSSKFQEQGQAFPTQYLTKILGAILGGEGYYLPFTDENVIDTQRG